MKKDLTNKIKDKNTLQINLIFNKEKRNSKLKINLNIPNCDKLSRTTKINL